MRAVTSPFFGRGVVGHEDVDGPRIVGREVGVL